jgi:hypothetical protein
MPFSTLQSARDTLGSLTSNATITIDNLFAIAADCDLKLRELLLREQSAIDALQPRPFWGKALDLLAWVLGVAGFTTGVADFYAEGGLSIWGWLGLVVGWIGLVVGATVYTRRIWTLDDCAADLDEILRWKDVLGSIIEEVQIRLTLV